MVQPHKEPPPEDLEEHRIRAESRWDRLNRRIQRALTAIAEGGGDDFEDEWEVGTGEEQDDEEEDEP